MTTKPEKINTAIDHPMNTVGLESRESSEKQFKNFFNSGKDVFVSLPTGYGLRKDLLLFVTVDFSCVEKVRKLRIPYGTRETRCNADFLAGCPVTSQQPAHSRRCNI